MGCRKCTLCPTVLIYGEGRGNLLKWDHVTKVIEGFVSRCCLGNRNINQRCLCRGLEPGALEKGEDGGLGTAEGVVEALGRPE